MPSGLIFPPIPADAVIVYSFFLLLFVTSTLHEADTLLPSWLLAVITALPSSIAVTNPFSTEATPVLLLLHFNCLFSASAGAITASINSVSPGFSSASDEVRVIVAIFPYNDSGLKWISQSSAYSWA